MLDELVDPLFVIWGELGGGEEMEQMVDLVVVKLALPPNVHLVIHLVKGG